MAGNRFVGDSKLELESFVVFGNSKRTLDHSGFFFKNFFSNESEEPPILDCAVNHCRTCLRAGLNVWYQ